MAIWLRDMPQWLEDAGLVVDTYPGWETRARSSGGYDSIKGIIIHHDAGAPSASAEARMAWEWVNAPTRPIGCMHLHFDGSVTVGAAGATNTAGKGGPWTTSKGVVPQDQGNAHTINIEASNTGTGTQAWTVEQQWAYPLIVATLCKHLDLNPLTDVYAHFEWAPTRKSDPAGPSKWEDGTGRPTFTTRSWNMNAFRADVAALLTPPPEEDDMKDLLIIWRDTVTGSNAVYLVGPGGVAHLDGPGRDFYKAQGVKVIDGTNAEVAASYARVARGIV